MLPVDDYVSALYPELILSTSYPVYLDIAVGQTSNTFFGTQYNYAVALRACHNYYLDNARPSGSAGSITGMTESRTSLSFWNPIPKGQKSALTMSSYGQRLQGLIAQIGAGASITTSDDDFNV